MLSHCVILCCVAAVPSRVPLCSPASASASAAADGKGPAVKLSSKISSMRVRACSCARGRCGGPWARCLKLKVSYANVFGGLPPRPTIVPLLGRQFMQRQALEAEALAKEMGLSNADLPLQQGGERLMRLMY